MARTVLAGTLWPEVTEEHARGSLRTTLWKLPRGELPLVRCRGDVLTVAPSLRVDIHVLTRTALGVMAGCVPQPGHRPPHGLLTGEDLLPGRDEDRVLLERGRLLKRQGRHTDTTTARQEKPWQPPPPSSTPTASTRPPAPARP
ncbi:hypothetical protein [Streptomyces hydrogenans]|uniref:hypothetical protein n=1 Tax=Streptomyces hydrogenans TaxID=1873719 RepID=UPI0037F2F161